jgi:hypothetical protein
MKKNKFIFNPATYTHTPLQLVVAKTTLHKLLDMPRRAGIIDNAKVVIHLDEFDGDDNNALSVRTDSAINGD